ncbi:MAG: peptidoglycan DD-metalloendopeptidase family protein [Clostridia bacterium]|nr:peptidoglycan DD-metalloendopeptidase family protein [Clostridia bacterium]
MRNEKNSHNKSRTSEFFNALLSVLMLPVSFVLSLPQRIKGFVKKLGNKELYKNAAHYTLNCKSYNPSFSGLFVCFKASGLGFFDSLYNALYMYVSEKVFRSEDLPKKRYGNTAIHPLGYNRKNSKVTFWSFVTGILDVIPRVCFIPSKISAKLKSNRLLNENSFSNIMRFVSGCRRKVSYILPVIMAAAVGLYIYNVSSSEIVLNVSYNGIELGHVENSDVINNVINSVEETISGASGVSMKLSGNITYSTSKTSSPDYATSSELYSDILTEAKKDYTDAYALYIDGTFVAACQTKTEIESVLNEFSGGDYTVIANGIQILKQDYPKNSVKTAEQLREILGNGSKPKEKLVVMSLNATTIKDEPAAPVKVLRNIPAPINDDEVDFSNAYAIDDTQKVLEINYLTEEFQQKTVVSKYETRYEYDPDMYITSKYVKQYGRDGSKKVTEKITYINGIEDSRLTVSEETIKQPIDKIVVCGLKPLPENSRSGEGKVMIWPYEGEINEHFGWRVRNNSYYEYHAGIDMSAPRGTPIFAAASGVVEKAGNFYNGYGKMVIIHHGDGIQTYYAHMNDIYVSTGDVITQGTIIGEIGSTGDSTGNHIHFEVRVDGTPDNPLNHLIPRGE